MVKTAFNFSSYGHWSYDFFCVRFLRYFFFAICYKNHVTHTQQCAIFVGFEFPFRLAFFFLRNNRGKNCVYITKLPFYWASQILRLSQSAHTHNNSTTFDHFPPSFEWWERRHGSAINHKRTILPKRLIPFLFFLFLFSMKM